MKKMLALLILTAAVYIFAPVRVAAAEAAELTAQCRTNRDALAILDANPGTKFTCKAGTTITIECEQPIAQLYIVWDKPAALWELAVLQNGAESVKSCGENGFLHEYVQLDTPATHVEFRLQGARNVLCDVRVFGAGDTPAWVQRWQPPWDKADLLLMAARGGDEFLCFGGALPYYAGELDKRVQVAYFTGGADEPDRMHEALDGVWAAGGGAYPVFSGFPSAAAATLEEARGHYSDDEFIAFSIEQLRRFQPEAVVGHSLNGEYGDGLHSLCAETLCVAAALSGDEMEYRDSAKKYGAWDVPRTYLHLYPEGGIELDWDLPLDSFSGRTALEVAQEGFAAHASRHTGAPENAIANDCRLFGLYRGTAGAGSDFLSAPVTERDAQPQEESAAQGLEADSAGPAAAANAPQPISAQEREPATPIPNAQANGALIPTMGIAALLCVAVALLLRRKKD